MIVDRKRLKVAFWVKVFPPRYESFILNQIDGMVRTGHELTVVTMKKGASRGLAEAMEARPHVICRPAVPSRRSSRILKAACIFAAGVWVRPVDMLSLAFGRDRESAIGTTQLLYDAQPFCGRNGFDIVHCQYGTLGIVAAELKRRSIIKGPLVTSFRGFDLSRVVSGSANPYRYLFQVGSLFLPVCQAFAERLEDLGCPPQRIRVLQSGIQVEKFPFHPRRVPPDEPVRILSIGRLVEKKGFEYGLRSVGLLLQRGLRVRYEVIGDGPLAGSLQRQAADLGISPFVEFSGWLSPDRVRSALKRAHLFLAPSITAREGSEEGIPNTIKEAMTCGLPVVATRHGGIPELVEDGVTGYLVPECDERALADGLGQLIRSEACWPEMGRAGRQRVEVLYDAHRLNTQLEQIYMELSDRARGAGVM